VAAPAQNDDGLPADQAGAADDDDLQGSPSLVDDWRPFTNADVAYLFRPTQTAISLGL
jgi:hypothetical protein